MDDPPPSHSAASADARSRGQAARHYVFVRHRHNWVLLTKFSVVGGSGVVVNLAVFSLVLSLAGHGRYQLAAIVAFLVANTTNYLLNKYWTFQERDSGNVALEYTRFLLVGMVGLAINLVVLTLLVNVLPAHPLDFLHVRAFDAITDKHVGQAVAIAIVTPVSFIGNKLWTFGAARRRNRGPLPPA